MYGQRNQGVSNQVHLVVRLSDQAEVDSVSRERACSSWSSSGRSDQKVLVTYCHSRTRELETDVIHLLEGFSRE